MTMPPATEPYAAQVPPTTGRPLNPLAVVSLIASILPLQLVGVITGHIALAQIKRTGDRGHGLALAGVIVGYVGGALTLIVGVLSAIAIPIFLHQQAAARDLAVQSDITNAKVAIVSQVVSDPSGPFPELDDLVDFTAGADTAISVDGDLFGFCIEGYSYANDTGAGATHYAASDLSGTVEGTCDENGVIVPAN